MVATETFYGLAADPSNHSAVEKVYRIKERLKSKPLPLIAANIDIVLKHLRNPHPRLLSLIEDFWPGSLTVVVSVDVPMASGAVNAEGKIAVRVPPPCPARTCAALSGGWVTATSANISGEPPPDRIERVSTQILSEASMVLDSGPTRGRQPSTIVEVLDDGEYRILREGAVSLKSIVSCCKRLTQV